jgi:hypothetical protein
MTSLVRQMTMVAGGQVPVTTRVANPIGPSSFPAMPTAAYSHPYSG